MSALSTQREPPRSRPHRPSKVQRRRAPCDESAAREIPLIIESHESSMPEITKAVTLLVAFVLVGCASEPPPQVAPASGRRSPETSTALPAGLSAGDLEGSLGPVVVLRGSMRRSDGVQRRVNGNAVGPFSMPGRGRTSGQVFDEDPDSPPCSRFEWPLPHRQFVHEMRFADDLAPRLGTLYVVDMWGPRLYYGLTLTDEVVPIRCEGYIDGQQHVWSFEPVHPRYGRQAADEFGDVTWVRAALAGDDPVLRLYVIDVLGAELLPVDEARRSMRFSTPDEHWYRSHVAVRGDHEVRRLVSAACDDPIEWIADAARRAAQRVN